MDHAQDLGQAVVELARDPVALGVDGPLLLGLVEAGLAHGDGGHVGEGAQQVLLGAREGVAGAGDAQLAEHALRAAQRAGDPGDVRAVGDQRALGVLRVVGRGLLVGDPADGAVVGHGEAFAAGPEPDPRHGRARVAEAGHRPLGAQEVARVLGDGVQDVLELGAAGELEGDGVEGLALPLAAVEVRDRHAQLGGAGDLARDVGEGRLADVGLDRRVEGEAKVADALGAADEREIHDARVDPGPAGVAGGVDGGVHRLVQDGPQPGQCPAPASLDGGR